MTIPQLTVSKSDNIRQFFGKCNKTIINFESTGTKLFGLRINNSIHSGNLLQCTVGIIYSVRRTIHSF